MVSAVHIIQWKHFQMDTDQDMLVLCRHPERTFQSKVDMSVCVCMWPQEDGVTFLYKETTAKQSDNIMDKWIQSFTQSLIQFFKAEMDGETALKPGPYI